jgi:diacylglycerol kinase family enzyme
MNNTAGAIDFQRLVVLANGRSSKADKIARITAELEAAYPGKVVQIRLASTDKANSEQLKNTLQKGDILLVCGGDGTISTVVDNADRLAQNACTTGRRRQDERHRPDAERQP